MSIIYTVDKYFDDGSDKVVGLLCTHTSGEVFITDKRIPLVDGTTDESYVQQAYAAAQSAINTWAAQFNVKGKTFNPSDNSLSS